MEIKKNIFKFIFLTVCVTLFSACNDSDDGSTPPDIGIKPNFSATVLTSVRGFVFDENNQALAGATIFAGTKTTQTNEQGYFEVKDVQLTKDISFILAEASGYFRGIRTWKGQAGGEEMVKLKLLPKTIVGSFSNTAGGTAFTADGASLIFPANGVVTSSGAAYTGDVNVAMKWLNPASDNILLEMPGDLRALNTDGGMIGLVTYGMLAVELTSASGDLLKVAPDKTVEMRMPIPAALQAAAPKDMPLWFFDETKGLWIEEGVSQRVGNDYIGNVKHFSFWNCDVPYNFVYFKSKFVDSKGNPLSGAAVRLTDKDVQNRQSYSYTDLNGMVSGYIPKRANMVMEVYSDVMSKECLIYSKPFTTTTQDVDMGIITIDNTNTKETVIIGSLLDCGGGNVAKGFVVYSQGMNTNMAKVVDGKYKFTVFTCSESPFSIRLVGRDDNAVKEGSLTLTVPMAGVEFEAPTITACDEINHIKLLLDGKNYTLSQNFHAYIWDRVEGGINYSSISLNGSYYGSADEDQIGANITWNCPTNATAGTFDMQVGDNGGSYYYDKEMGEAVFKSGKVTLTSVVRNAGVNNIIIIGTYQGVIQNFGTPVVEKNISGSFYYNGPLIVPS